MTENGTYDRMEQLILRYLNKETTPSEVEELETWVQEDAQNKAVFITMHKAWVTSGALRESDVNVDAEWNRLAQVTTEKSDAKIVRMHPGRKLLRIAAVVGFLIVAGLAVYLFSGDGNTYVAKADMREIQLDDGSTVALNRSSTLKWRGKDGTRHVELKGDAYFDVARDPSRPFVISAGDVEVEVLGTAFSVDAREGVDEINVTVERGSVAVRNGDNDVTLVPGERAVFDKKAKSLLKEENTDPNFASVRTQTLVFEDSPLDEVVSTLNRHYHAQISASQSALETCAITATFERKSLDAVLQIITSTIDIQVIRQNKNIILQGSCTQH